MSRFIFGVAAACMLAASATAEPGCSRCAEALTLTPVSWLCLNSRLPAYIARKADPVVVVVGGCQPRAAKKRLSADQRIAPTVSNEAEPTGVAVLTKRQLRCLQSYMRTASPPADGESTSVRLGEICP